MKKLEKDNKGAERMGEGDRDRGNGWTDEG